MDIANALKKMNLEMPALQQQKALAFLHFLEKWNHAYSLTAIREIDAMVTHHLLDSLSVAPYVKGKHIIDIGTGAGFPGIPLALYYPDKQFTLLDSNGKKTRFLLQVKAEFNINNVDVVQERAENYQTVSCFDAIIFRAVKSIPEMISKTHRLCCKNGQFLAMKATYPVEELEDLNHPFTAEPLSVPGLDAERHLIIIEGAASG